MKVARGLILFLTQVTLGVIALEIQGGFPVSSTANGLLRGTVSKSRDGRDFYSFKGVKYGEANRFELAQPPKSWNGIRDAKNYGARCPGWGLLVRKVLGETEDCLFLNVFVPHGDDKMKGGLPVMFWIHGGGFLDGTSSEYGPDFFMDQDVILVTINYRLGILGFLNTEDGTVPANNGLKDMILALKWVQKNIAAFGGDPGKVTVFGESAGAASTHFLVLSPAAKGLFRAAILQSGSALVSWALQDSPLQEARNAAVDCNCTAVKTSDMVDCLKNADLQEIFNSEAKPRTGSNLAFAPSVEIITAGSKDMLVVPGPPLELLTKYKDNSKDVPMLVGTNENEGWFYAAVLVADQSKLTEVGKHWIPLTLGSFGHLRYMSETDVQTTGNKLKAIYSSGDGLTTNDLVNLFSDLAFNRGARLLTELHSYHGSPVYPYMVTHEGGHSIVLAAGLERNGITHADELQYLFYPMSALNLTWPDLEPNSADEEFSDQLVTLWASFATECKFPSPWEPVSMEKLEDRNYPVMVLDNIPEFKTNDKLYERVVNVDTLLSPYEKPQISWRGSKGIRDEL